MYTQKDFEACGSSLANDISRNVTLLCPCLLSVLAVLLRMYELVYCGVSVLFELFDFSASQTGLVGLFLEGLIIQLNVVALVNLINIKTFMFKSLSLH